MQNAFDALVAIAGVNWLYALAAAFVAIVAESAQAPHHPGEEPAPALLRGIAPTTILIASVLLLAHASVASMAANQSFFLAVAAALLVMAAASIIGALLARVRVIGGPLHAAAPVLAVGACALAIWVNWRDVWSFVQPVLAR